MRMTDQKPICPSSGNKDRIMRQNATSTIFYLYDREDRIADYDQSGNLLISYTHGPGIDEPVAMTLNNSTYFYIPDIQGSIRAIVDMNGNAVATYQYDAWGSLVSYNGTLAKENDYLYTGREYDWETGIYYYRARYYNPELGRFISQDPAGMVDGPNMYVYVKNSPVNGVDPSGKSPIIFYLTSATFVQLMMGLYTIHEFLYPNDSISCCYYRRYEYCQIFLPYSMCVNAVQHMSWHLQSSATCVQYWFYYWGGGSVGGGYNGPHID